MVKHMKRWKKTDACSSIFNAVIENIKQNTPSTTFHYLVSNIKLMSKQYILMPSKMSTGYTKLASFYCAASVRPTLCSSLYS